MAAARRSIRVRMGQLTPELQDYLRAVSESLDIDVVEGAPTGDELRATLAELREHITSQMPVPEQPVIVDWLYLMDPPRQDIGQYDALTQMQRDLSRHARTHRLEAPQASTTPAENPVPERLYQGEFLAEEDRPVYAERARQLAAVGAIQPETAQRYERQVAEAEHMQAMTAEEAAEFLQQRQRERVLNFGRIYGRRTRNPIDLSVSVPPEDEGLAERMRQEFVRNHPAVAEHLAGPRVEYARTPNVMEELRTRLMSQPLRAERILLSERDWEDLQQWTVAQEHHDAAVASIFAQTVIKKRRVPRPYRLGDACQLKTDIDIDTVINLRGHGRVWTDDHIKARKSLVDRARMLGWSKRSSRRLWAEAIERGEPPIGPMGDDWGDTYGV